MITNLSNLKFNIMSNEKFDEKQENNLLQENEIYLTPAPKVDNEPIENSKNLITSGGVFEALQNAGGSGASDWNDIQNKPENLSDFNNDLDFQTEDDLNLALSYKQDTLSFDDSPINGSENPIKSGGVFAAVNEVMLVATGKCKSFVFNTVSELDTWLLNSSNTVNLNTGDVFLIRDVNVPDYWWDKTSNSKQILETTKVDLTDYALKTEIPSSLPANGGNSDTVDGYHIRTATEGDTGLDGYITFVLRSST